MYAYYCSNVIGTGTDDDAFRPEIGDEPGIEGYACCYELPEYDRVVVLVKAPEDVHVALETDYERLYTVEEVSLAVG